jgi:hypothetical protein
MNETTHSLGDDGNGDRIGLSLEERVRAIAEDVRALQRGIGQLLSHMRASGPSVNAHDGEAP